MAATIVGAIIRGCHRRTAVAATGAEIDDLVYELYDITDEERKIIGRG